MIYDPGEDELCTWAKGRWVKSRVCSCGMCRYFPAETTCPANQYGGGPVELKKNPNAVQLYYREYPAE